MDNSKNNQNVRMDSIEDLSQKICDKLKKKKIKSDDVRDQQLIIWLDCTDETDFARYGSSRSRESMKEYLHNERYIFSSIVFRMGKPDKEDIATSLGDNCPEWFTVRHYEGPKETPIEAELCACDGFELMNEKYVLSVKDMEKNKLRQYNIGRGKDNNQIAFKDSDICKKNESISRTLAHIELAAQLNRFFLVFDNEESAIGVARSGRWQPLTGKKIMLQSGDIIVVNNVPTLKYTDNQNETNHQNEPHEITLRSIKEILLKGFTEWTKNESEGETLLFPTTFNILMNTADFQDKRGLFKDWMPEILSAFYGTLRSYKQTKELPYRGTNMLRNWTKIIWAKITKKEYYKEEYTSKIYIPYPQNGQWIFQFISLDCDIDGKTKIQRGVPSIYFSRSNITDYNTENKRVVVTGIPTKIDKDGKATKVTDDKLAKINVMDHVVYNPPFNTKLPTSVSEIAKLLNLDNAVGKKVYAVIRNVNAREEWDMTSKRVSISGEPDSQNDAIVISNSHVEKNHLVIRYDDEKNEFLIAAFAPTLLNGLEMRFRGQNPNWESLPKKNSTIVLGNNDVMLTFNAKDKFL